MRRITAIFSLALLATTFLIGLPGDSRVDALSGCCKQRDSYKSSWYPNEMSFDQCNKSNERDKDSIFDKSGLFWWDVDC